MAIGLRSTCVAACLQSCFWLCLGNEPWEWAGVFDFPEPAHYIWSAARGAQGQYADPRMKMVFVATSAASSEGLHDAEARAETLWNGAVTDVDAGDEVEATDAAYRLVFDQRTWVSNFEIHVDTPGAYAIFTEHSPLEFENGFHFLKTETGADVEAAVEEGGGHGHGHGEEEHADEEHADEHCPWAEPWEWAGVFELGDVGHYTWSASRGSGGSYADAEMRIIVLPAANSSEEGLEAAAANAHALWESGTTTQKSAGDELQVGGSYTLNFDDHSWVSHFLLQVTAPGAVAIFAQHLPTEFEKDFHYFKTSAGEDVEPAMQVSVAMCSDGVASEATEQSNTGLWGAVLAGSFLTTVPALLGVLFVVQDMASKAKSALQSASPFINSFASGVIFAAAIFLLLPEALHLAGSGHADEVVGTWTWGACVLGGWLSCSVITSLCLALEGNGEAPVAASVEDADPEKMPKASNALALALPVLLGDFFHNFTDGLVLGVAFKVCGAAFGWELVAVTIAHEAPQEIADLIILILDARVRWYWATLANYLSSTSTVIGAIITYGASVGANAHGRMLAYGAGFYLYVAITELGSLSRPAGLTRPQLLIHFTGRALAFTLGCIVIGLVLLGHDHCSAAPDDEHHDHNH